MFSPRYIYIVESCGDFNNSTVVFPKNIYFDCCQIEILLCGSAQNFFQCGKYNDLSLNHDLSLLKYPSLKDPRTPFAFPQHRIPIPARPAASHSLPHSLVSTSALTRSNVQNLILIRSVVSEEFRSKTELLKTISY